MDRDDDMIQDCETCAYKAKHFYEEPCKHCYPWGNKYEPIEKEGNAE